MTPTEALTDLYQRLVNAEATLKTASRKHAPGTDDQVRLQAKAEGVSLARDYVRHTLAIVENAPADLYAPPPVDKPTEPRLPTYR